MRTRRRLVMGAAVAGAASALPLSALAQTSKIPANDPLAPNPVDFNNTIARFTGGAKPLGDGLVLDVPLLADNPSAVPIKVKVTLPITAQEWCEEIILLAELNPTPLACRLLFFADTGTAEASVRVRLSQSQNVHALARMKSGKILAAKQSVTVAVSGCGM